MLWNYSVCCDDARKFELTINKFCTITSKMNLFKNKTIQLGFNLIEDEVFC